MAKKVELKKDSLCGDKSILIQGVIYAPGDKIVEDSIDAELFKRLVKSKRIING